MEQKVGEWMVINIAEPFRELSSCTRLNATSFDDSGPRPARGERGRRRIWAPRLRALGRWPCARQSTHDHLSLDKSLVNNECHSTCKLLPAEGHAKGRPDSSMAPGLVMTPISLSN